MPRHHALPVLRPDPAPPSQGPKEKCAVVAIWGEPGPARLISTALFSLQHRGQESTGLALSHAGALTGVTGMGLVPEVFDEEVVSRLERDAPGARGGIGHNRYSTSGGSHACNAQPIMLSYVAGQIAIAHNGNLINNDLLRRRFEEAGHIFQTTSDTEAIVHLLAMPRHQRASDPLSATLRHLQGAFSLAMLFPDRIECSRDPWGFRPLVLGRLPGGGLICCSETVALDVLGARYLREVEPGEIVTLDDAGVESGRPASRRFADPAPRLARCVFEHVYFANPASLVFGQNVQETRELLGEALARESPPPPGTDFVVPMPDSGRSAALGFARAARLPYREAIVPNRYVGRTFIKPTQEGRNQAVRLKLNIIGQLVRGKGLVVVDDSIVRGTTTRAKMDQLRAAGAREIHLRISCPPIRHPCYFGVDFAERSQLIAHERSVEDIRAYLGVDSLAYLSLEGLLSCMRGAGDSYCHACYSGRYPIDPATPTTEEFSEHDQLRMFA